MSEEAQREAIAFLSGICARAGDASPQISTHISRIFFAGDTVYKLKRSVQTAYLDFSTAEKRLAACESEVSLNRRTAPSLYRGVRRVTREPSGLAFDGPGETIDAVVEMQRFEQENLFDAMARSGVLTAQHIEALARRIAAFHRDAEVSCAHGGASAIADILASNETELRSSFLTRERDIAALCDCMRAALAAHARLLDARRDAGKVRRCHGDLTLRNIALIDGEPTPFDCLEFDETLATTDVLYDVSFVLMDLMHRSRGDLANSLFNRYLDSTCETDGLPLLPLFIAMRAVIRAHVTARMSNDASGDERETLKAEARAYLDLAACAMRESRAVLVGIGGFSGSGKSTVAAALAPLLAPLPGARVLSSDRIRKAMFCVPPTQRLAAEAYVPEVSQRVYAIAREEAQACLAAGWSVICDAVFDRHADRDALQEMAASLDVPFRGFWLAAPEEMLASRIAARTVDPSDATAEVLRAQETKFAARGERMDWPSLDAARPAAETARRMLAAAGS